MKQEYIDIDDKQYYEIGEIVKKICDEYSNNNEVEIKFGKENPNEKENFKFIFPLSKYNETIYSYIKETAVAYHVSKDKSEDIKFTTIHFFIKGKEVDKYKFYYNQEMLEELNTIKK